MSRQSANRLRNLIVNCQGEELSRVLTELAEDGKQQQNWVEVLEDSLPGHWGEIAGCYLNSACDLAALKPADASQNMVRCIEGFRKQWAKEKDKVERASWSLPVLYNATTRLRFTAENAASELAATSPLTEAISVLQKIFGACHGDRSSDFGASLKSGELAVMNTLFKVYFKMGNARLSQALIKAVEKDQEKDPNLLLRFPLSHQVTYYFYLSRVFLFEGKAEGYEKAEGFLSKAFSQCHKDYSYNLTRILTYLVTVKLLRGYFPPEGLLEKYGLVQFIDVVNAVKTGNLKKFDVSMEKHKTWFIQNGVYVMLLKCKMVCYRNLIYIISRLMDQVIEGGMNARLKLDYVQWALQELGANEESEIDEIECMLANLVHMGYVKGYIAHNNQTVVLAKGGGDFPKPTAV